MSKTLLRGLAATLLLLPLWSHAVCYYNGQPHPTGTKIEGRTCQPDGTWR